MLNNFIRLIKRCFALAAPYGRAKILLILAVLFANGLMQVIGVASIFPFFTFVADPERIRNSPIGTWIFSHLPYTDHSSAVIWSGVAAVLLLFAANAFALAGEVIRTRYSQRLGHFLRMQMLESFASRDYAYFLERNSGSMLNKLLGDVATFIQAVLQPLLEILSRLVVVTLLLLTIFLIHPYIALGSGMFLGGFYAFIFVALKRRSRLIGEGLNIANRGAHVRAMQFIHGIKPILVHGKATHFMEAFAAHSTQQAFLNSKLPIYGSGPRYLIEPIAFGGLVLIVLALTLQGSSFNSMLPNLALIALAGYRILPSFQLLYGLLNQVYAMRYVVAEVETEIAEFKPVANDFSAKTATSTLSFQKEIRLEDISFRYPAGKHFVLRNFSFVVRKNQAIGIAGVSGSGKSTLVDIILGLHRPEKGTLCVDGRIITTDDLASWRSLIGYVPQDIYLLDASIAENIAFGIPRNKIDASSLKKAAKAAQILNFIETELPNAWETIVGERGVRLSGGQKQRIGLARALYHQPQLLILDEATSALDLKTETAVMKTIQALQKSVTMIIIAHRLTTLEKCDKIIRLK